MDTESLDQGYRIPQTWENIFGWGSVLHIPWLCTVLKSLGSSMNLNIFSCLKTLRSIAQSNPGLLVERTMIDGVGILEEGFLVNHCN